MAKLNSPREVQCYHCRRRFEVDQRAITIPCPSCHQNLQLEDVVVKSLKSVVTLQTCGRLVVERKGRVAARSVVAHGGVEVKGILEGNVLSGGPVYIGPSAAWKGDCRAPSLRVELGGTILGGYFVIPDNTVRDGVPAG